MAETYLFYCPACHAERVAPRSLIGRRVRCVECGELVTAPPPTTPAERQLRDTWEREEEKPAFDPYYKWLAIPRSEQPPNYYRLLGLPLFEDDADVISISTDRQMSHVRAQAGGKFAAESQRLLNELAHASVCLLDPAKKAVYDQKLKEQQAANPPGAATNAAQADRPATPSDPDCPVGSGTVSGFSPIALPDDDDKYPPGASPKAADKNREAKAPEKKSPQRPAKKVTSEASEAAAAKPPDKETEASKPAKPTGPSGMRTEQKLQSGLTPLPPEPAPVAGLVPLPAQPPKPEPEPEPRPVSFARDPESSEAEMDMTPMVDVTFLLLIFFMVTAAFALQRSFQLPTPDSDQPSPQVAIEDVEEDPDIVIVRVDAYGTYRVMTPDWDQEAPSEQELLIKLREARDSLGPSQLMVIANGEALHERVVTALDAGAEIGVENVKLVTVEEDEE